MTLRVPYAVSSSLRVYRSRWTFEFEPVVKPFAESVVTLFSFSLVPELLLFSSVGR